VSPEAANLAEVNPELDALALHAWPDVVELIDTLVRRAEAGGWGTVQPRTSLATDDARTSPFQSSHVVQLLLNAATDNLHGVRHMIWGPLGQQTDQPILHQAAHYLLARGAMENAAAALWILAPPSRAERVTRTLRWHAQNAKDQAQALADLPGATVPDLKQRQTRLAEVCFAATGSDPARFRPGYTVTETMRYVTDLEQGRSGFPAIFVWRLCSGFAHGRPWASLSFQDVQTQPTVDPDVFSARMTSDLTRALLAPKHALHLIEQVLKLYAARNTPM
jgi:hypothetical protein